MKRFHRVGPWRGIGTAWLRREGDTWRAWWTPYNEVSEPFDQTTGTQQQAVAWARSVPARQRLVWVPPDSWVDLDAPEQWIEVTR